MKKKTKVIIAGTAIGVVALSVGGTVILTSATNKVEDQPVMPNTTAVERMDLTNKITLSGTVKSGNISTVKSSLSGMKVKSVNVKVGDEVKKGDVIAVLDDSDLQEKLTEAKKSLKNTKTKNELELSAADRNYESTISAADKSVRDAEKSVSDAQKAYNEAYDEDTKIYKEYLEALEKKNKAYEKFKPYENKDKEKDSDEKEKAYSKACEKLAQKESNLAPFAVIPNPNNGTMKLNFEYLTGKIGVRVYDMKGTLIDQFETFNGNGPSSYDYNMRVKADGIYFFVATGKEGTLAKKVVIQH